MKLLNLKTILTKSNFTKKEGAEVHMVVLHFVYMLVMNKKYLPSRNKVMTASVKMCITGY